MLQDLGVAYFRPVTCRRPGLFLPLFLSPVRAGYPSPADDHVDIRLDLNQHLVRHPSATFFLRVEGDSMLGAGIHPGDLLIADRSLRPNNNQVIIALVEGEFTVKRFRRKDKGKVYLEAANPDYKPIEITPDTGFEVWGVVTHVIHPV